MHGTAIVVTDGHLADTHGKTAHGLIRVSDRFVVLAVVDEPCAGRDAGEVLDGRRRGVPIYASVDEALANLPAQPDYCVVGCASHGGVITPSLRETLEAAVRAGLSIVNGLHEFLSDDPKCVALAKDAGVSIIDIRKPRAPLRFWTGAVYSVKAPRIAVLGTECAVGKRTTAQLLVEACRSSGMRAEMIYTGQTGWMQGAAYGLILDAIPNDFVSGEMERAIVDCDRELRPDVIFIEGQSALRSPSGPCGSEHILSGAARGVVLQHAPGRRFFHGFEKVGCVIPPVAEDVALIRLLGARTLALTLNDDGLTDAQLSAERDRLAAELGLPVALPLKEGVEGLVPVIERYITEERSA